jgi:GT2 family glycosyltransferase
MKISIIVISFNTKNITLNCLDSIGNEGSPYEKEVIVVDNASSDGSLKALKSYKKRTGLNLKIIENKVNLGFAKANNQGIYKAKGKYIMLLNSDTLVKKRVFEKLIKFAEKKKSAGAVVPRLVNKDSSIQGSVFLLPTIRRVIRQYWLGEKGLLDKYWVKGEKPAKVEAAVMAAFLITPQAMKKVGLLNERYFMYYEDLDYCRRINTSGLKVYYYPKATVVHYHGESGKGLADNKNQWRRLIPSSKAYHGVISHYLFNFIIWSGQKWQKFSKNI